MQVILLSASASTLCGFTVNEQFEDKGNKARINPNIKSKTENFSLVFIEEMI
jgi:hypothetical protein